MAVVGGVLRVPQGTRYAVLYTHAPRSRRSEGAVDGAEGRGRARRRPDRVARRHKTVWNLVGSGEKKKAVARGR